MRQGTIPGLDKSSPIPLYFQLENWLLEEIKNGTYPVGQCIPPESRLKEMFGVSRTTVRQAINKLIESGRLARNGTKGTIVTVPGKKSASIRSMEPFNRQIVRAGQVPRTEVLKLQIIQADEFLAEKLQISPGSRVISMFRRRFADDVAVMTLQSFLPYETSSFILDHDFTWESLYEVLSLKEDRKPCGVKQSVEAQFPTSEDVKLFNMETVKPILSFECQDRNAAGEIVSYNLLRYRGDCMRFEVDVVEGTADRSFCPLEAAERT